MPVAPVFLMSPGRDSTVLKGTELTAYTKNDAVMEARELPETQKGVSELDQLIRLLPPRVLNGEGREGDMLNLIFLASEDDLQQVFARAGWLKADHSKFQIIWRLWKAGRKKRILFLADRAGQTGTRECCAQAQPGGADRVRSDHVRSGRTQPRRLAALFSPEAEFIGHCAVDPELLIACGHLSAEPVVCEDAGPEARALKEVFHCRDVTRVAFVAEFYILIEVVL